MLQPAQILSDHNDEVFYDSTAHDEFDLKDFMDTWKSYHDRYNVKGYLINGVIKLWNCRVNGFLVKYTPQEVYNAIVGRDITDIKIIRSGNDLKIIATHHDGTNYFLIRTIDATGLNIFRRHNTYPYEQLLWSIDRHARSIFSRRKFFLDK